MKVKDLFNKELRELESSDLETYLQDPLEESDVIEYKSFAGEEGVKERERKILKTICSFLNSSGGILIWGAPEEIKEGKDNVLQKELSPIDHVIKKDHFIAKVLNRIIPSPSGIRCEAILVGEDKCVLVFEVEESKNRPHQFENIYYMRADGQTIAAPHHYVEALFKQVRYPILEGSLEFRKSSARYYSKHHVKSLPDNQKSDSRNSTNASISQGYIEVEVNVFVRNKSIFINEVNLAVSIVVENIYQGEKREIIFPTTHYGKTEILIPKIKLPISYESSTHKTEISLLFAGQMSPLKCSRYLVEYGLNQKYENPNSERLILKPWLNIISRDENKFYFEVENEPIID